MTARKCITWDEMVARGWFSRTWWRAKGVVIVQDATPRDTAWKRTAGGGMGFSYPVFAGTQGHDTNGNPISQEMADAISKPKPLPEIPSWVDGLQMEIVYRAAARFKQIQLPASPQPVHVQTDFAVEAPSQPYAYFGDKGHFYLSARLRSTWMDHVHKRGLDRLPDPVTVKRAFIIDAGPWIHEAGIYFCEAQWIVTGSAMKKRGWIAWQTGDRPDQVIAYGLGCNEKIAISRLQKEAAAQRGVLAVPLDDADAMATVF